MSHIAVFHYLRAAQLIKFLLDSVVSPPTVRTLFHPSQKTLSVPVLNTLRACSRHGDFIMNQQKKKKKAEELTGCGLKRHNLKCTVVLRGGFFSIQCKYSSLLILCSSAWEWLMYPLRRSLASLMGSHFYAFQPRALRNWIWSDTVMMTASLLGKSSFVLLEWLGLLKRVVIFSAEPSFSVRWVWVCPALEDS